MFVAFKGIHYLYGRSLLMAKRS